MFRLPAQLDLRSLEQINGLWLGNGPVLKLIARNGSTVSEREHATITRWQAVQATMATVRRSIKAPLTTCWKSIRSTWSTTSRRNLMLMSNIVGGSSGLGKQRVRLSGISAT